MKITNVKINNFGSVRQKNINFNEGITVIYGKNESGKSAILKFIQGMFYGLNKNKNGKNISDYERYTPWQGEEFSGKLNYKLNNNKKYEIYRDFRKKNIQILDENAQDITKEYSIDKTKGSQFFIEQVKIEEELFLSTALIEQQSVKLKEKQQEEVLQKIANLINTGKDDISFQKTIQKLNKRLLEQIGTQRSQDRPINIIQDKINQTKLEIQQLKVYQEEKYNKQQNKNEQEVELKKLQLELKFLEELYNIRESKKSNLQKIQWNKQIQQEYQQKIEQLEQTKKKVPVIKKKTLTIALGLILTVIFELINIILFKNIVIRIAEILSILGLIFWYGIDYLNKRKKIQTLKEGNETIQNKINILQNEINEKSQEAEEIQEKINKEYLLKEEILKNYYNKIIEKDKLKKYFNIEEVKPNIEFLQNKINEIKLNIHRIEIEQSNILPKLENLNSLQEQLEYLQEQYEQLLEERNCIQIAKEEIEKAYEQMKNTIAPKFTISLSENMKQISNGKYQNIKIQNENTIVVETQEGNYVNADMLSIGTIDQLYLSLRLGVINNVKEAIPIFLDETFAFFDDERLKNILQYLANQYSDRQIIIFTCTNREKLILEAEKINFTLVNL